MVVSSSLPNWKYQCISLFTTRCIGTLLPLELWNVLKGICTREAVAGIRLALQWCWGLNSLWKTYQQLFVVFFLLLSWWLSVVKSYVVSLTDEWMSREHWWNDTDMVKQVLGEIPVPIQLCPPQIPLGPALDWTSASEVRGQWRSASVVTHSSVLYSKCSKWKVFCILKYSSF